MIKRRVGGFTLIELIVAMAIVTILSVVVIIAINPARQFAQARNQQRRSDTRAIAQALYQHAADNGGIVSSQITTSPKRICNDYDGTGPFVCSGDTVDLFAILGTNYISFIPKDPLTGTDADTRYTVVKDNNNHVTVLAPNAEFNESVGFKEASDGAVTFNGTNYGTAANVPVSTTAGTKNTVAFWTYWDGTNAVMPIGWSTQYNLYIGSSCFGFNTANGDVLGVAASVLPVNSWVHISAIFYNGVPSASNNELYINGVKQNISYCLGSSSASRLVTQNFFIAGWGFDANFRFSGGIDDVRIYNRALSQSEAEDLARDLPVTSGLVGYWHFAEGSGAASDDSSVNNNSMVLINSPNWIDRTAAIAIPPSFAPDSLTGLALWLKGDAGTYQSTGGAAATADGNAVGQWQDQSTNANHIDQTTVAARPTLKTGANGINNKAIVRFDGLNDYLQKAALSLGSNDFTLFLIARRNGTQGGAYHAPIQFGLTGYASTGSDWFQMYDNGTANMNFNVASLRAGSGSSMGVAAELYTFRKDNTASTSQFWRNGVSVGTGTGTQSIANGFFLLGSWNNNYFNGDFAEVVLYNRAVTETERQDIETYLRGSSRWNF